MKSELLDRGEMMTITLDTTSMMAFILDDVCALRAARWAGMHNGIVLHVNIDIFFTVID
jgi:hypothetical protein